MLSPPKFSTYNCKPKNVHTIMHKPLLINRICKERGEREVHLRATTEVSDDG